MKEKTKFVCGECGYENVKWLGCCPMCGSWNTMVESAPMRASSKALGISGSGRAAALSSIDAADAVRVKTGIGEFDRVLGGGVIAGSVILIGGAPGIGKSTLIMQAASNLIERGNSVLYVSGEESSVQLKLRAKRCCINEGLLVMTETLIEAVADEVNRLKPRFLIIDSIQTMLNADLSSAAGSATQIREATIALTRLAKQSSCAVFIIGHVTKEGALAGPRMLEHMVDTVLYFEGDRHDAFRIVRAVKNRFGSTNEIGVFEMRQEGMAEAKDASALFVSGGDDIGCGITCVMEGTRPMLVEVQTLLTQSNFSNPRRMAGGMDTGRLLLLLAVLERRAGIRVSDKDVYTNAVGGIRIDERAADLAITLAIAGAALEKRLPERTAIVGEISLTGEIRPVDRLLGRVQECARLGYARVIAPRMANLCSVGGIETVQVGYLADAVRLLK